jgi:WD40 repeat protein
MPATLRTLAALALALLAACAAPPAPPPPPTPAATEAAAAPTAAPATAALPTAQPTALASPTPLPPTPTAAPTAPPPGPALPPPTATPGFPESRITEATLPSLRLLRTVGLGGATHAAIAPDNSLLAVSTTAGVALFELPSLRHLRFDAIPGGAVRVAFGDDGASLLVTVGGGDRLERRRLADGAVEASSATSTPMFQPDFDSPSGEYRAVMPFPDSATTPGVTITRLADGATVYADDDTLTASFSPDSRTAVLVGLSDTVRLIDLAAGEPVNELVLPAYWGVGFTPDAQALLTTGRSAWLWDVVSGTPRQGPLRLGQFIEQAPFGGQQAVRASADGQTVTIEGSYGYFEFTSLAASGWRYEGGALSPLWESSAGGPGITNYATYAGAMSPANDAVASTEDGVNLELDSSDMPARGVQITAGVGALTFSPDGVTLAVGDQAGGVRLFPVMGGPERSIGQLAGPVRGLVFNPDGSLLAARAEDGSIAVWRVSDGLLVARVQDEPSAGPFLLTADGELLIAWGGSSVRFYRLSDGQRVHTLEQGAAQAAIGPRTRILALLVDGRVQLWGIP